jgi:hypothetical protein
MVKDGNNLSGEWRKNLPLAFDYQLKYVPLQPKQLKTWMKDNA